MIKVKVSCHGMPCIEVFGGDPKAHEVIKRTIRNNRIDAEAYVVSVKAGAFLQGEQENPQWTLVEFWKNDYDPFVRFINEEIGEWKEE